MIQPDADHFVLLRPDGNWHLFDEAYELARHAEYEQHSRQLRPSEACARRSAQVSLIVFVSEACNLRCDYCKVSSMIMSPNKTLTDPKAISAAIQAAASTTDGQVDVVFFGGEPLLEFEAINNICRNVSTSAAGKRVFYSLTTNGTLLTDRILSILQEHQICVGVSIDGPSFSHDAHRVSVSRRDTHKRTIANYRRMKRAGVECGPISVVTDPTQIESVFDYFASEFRDQTVYLKPLEVRGSEDIVWLAEYFSEYVRGQLRLLARCVRETGHGLPRRVETRTLSAVRNVLLSADPNVRSCNTAGNQGCTIGQEILAVEADGRFIPCPNVKKYSRRDSAWIKLIETRGGYCDDCRYRPVCPGFCMADMDEEYVERFFSHNETVSVDVLCEANRQLVDGIFRLYRQDAIALSRYALSR